MTTTQRIVGVVMVVLILAYAPFLIMSQYLHPLGIHEWDWISGLAWGDVELSWWQRMQIWWTEVGGRYSSAALVGTLPDWYSLGSFRGAVFLLLLITPLALIYALGKLLPGGIGVLVGSICWLLFLHQLTNVYDSLLRATCLPIYHLAVAGFAMLALLLRGWYVQGFKLSWQFFFAVLLVIFLIGTNELSIVHVLLLLGATAMVSFQSLRRLPVGLLLLGLVALCSTVFSLSAPGNIARMELYSASAKLLETVGLTLATSVFLMADWLFDSLLVPATVLILLLRPFFLNISKEGLLQRPHLWAAGIVLLCPSSLFPLLYGTNGSSLPERIVDILFLLFAVLFMLFWLSLAEQFKPLHGLKQRSGWLAAAIGVYLFGQVFFGGLSLDRSAEKRQLSRMALIDIRANAGKAYLQLVTGIPQAYDQQMSRIERDIRTCRTDTCWVPRLEATTFVGYDPTYDRMQKDGEYGLVRHLGGNGARVARYKEE